MRIFASVCIICVLPFASMVAQVAVPDWSVEPVWSARSGDPSLSWSAIGWVVVRQDGLIAVSQPEDGAVHFLSRDGAFLTRAGGRGAGPGEFRAMSVAAWFGDTLAVLDPGNSRLATVTIDGEIVTRPIRFRLSSTTNQSPPMGPTRTLGLIGGGILLLAGRIDPDPLSEWPAPDGEDRILITDGSGLVVRQLMTMPTDPCFANVSLPTGRASIRRPLCQSGLTDVSPDGGEIGAVTDGADGNSTVTLTNVTTGRQREHSLRVLPRSIPSSAADSVREALAANAPDPLGNFIRRQLELPSHYPNWRSFLIDRDGRVWLEYWRAAGPPQWLVLSPSGTMLARIALPEGAKLKAIDRDRAIVVQTNPNGEESLVALRIRQ